MYINRDLTGEEIYKLINDISSMILAKGEVIEKNDSSASEKTQSSVLCRLEKEILEKSKGLSKAGLSIVTCGYQIYMVPEDGVFQVLYVDGEGDSADDAYKMRSIDFNTAEELAVFMKKKAEEDSSTTEEKMIVDRLEQKNDD